MTLTSPAYKPHAEKWLAGIQEIVDPKKGLGTVRAPVDTIREITRTVHARCPMHGTIAKLGPVVDTLVVNGIEVPL